MRKENNGQRVGLSKRSSVRGKWHKADNYFGPSREQQLTCSASAADPDGFSGSCALGSSTPEELGSDMLDLEAAPFMLKSFSSAMVSMSKRKRMSYRTPEINVLVVVKAE